MQPKIKQILLFTFIFGHMLMTLMCLLVTMFLPLYNIKILKCIQTGLNNVLD